jgi:D-alanyl-D-alanine carboxypeptidase (penicillin-binding protein 5/6)
MMLQKSQWYGVVLSIILLISVFGALPVAAESAVVFDVPVESAILIDGLSGQVLFEKNADLKLPPASMAKMMTMLLVMEEIDAGRAKLTDQVKVSARSATTGGSQVYLKQGEVFTIEEMMKAVTIHSANDASVALAEHFAGAVEAFVDRMNRRAQELGLKNTYFSNPDGLPPEEGEAPTLSTARDLTVLARELLKHPKIFEWTVQITAPFRTQTTLYNTNKLIGKYQGLDGLKTGHTEEAGWCLAATAKRGDVRLISVVMRGANENDRQTQTARLLDYGFTNFEPVQIAAAGAQVGSVKIRTGWPGVAAVNVNDTLAPLVMKGSGTDVVTQVILDENVKPPLKAGDRVGVVVVKAGDRELVTTDAVLAVDVKKANFIILFFRWVKGLFVGLFS